MSDAITELSSEELDAVGAGLYVNVDLSTNVYKSRIYQTNYSSVYTKYSDVSVTQSNNVGTTVILGG